MTASLSYRSRLHWLGSPPDRSIRSLPARRPARARYMPATHSASPQHGWFLRFPFSASCPTFAGHVGEESPASQFGSSARAALTRGHMDGGRRRSIRVRADRREWQLTAASARRRKFINNSACNISQLYEHVIYRIVHRVLPLSAPSVSDTGDGFGDVRKVVGDFRKFGAAHG